jgi:hypothetical protein
MGAAAAGERKEWIMAVAGADEAALLRIAELTRAARDARRGCRRRLLLDGPESRLGEK